MAEDEKDEKGKFDIAPLPSGPASEPTGRDPVTGHFLPGNPWAPKKGERRNPSGVAKNARVSRELQRYLNQGGAEVAMRKLLEILQGPSASAALDALKILLDRTEGKVTQTHRIEASRPKRVVIEGGSLNLEPIDPKPLPEPDLGASDADAPE